MDIAIGQPLQEAELGWPCAEDQLGRDRIHLTLWLPVDTGDLSWHENPCEWSGGRQVAAHGQELCG